MAKNVLVTGASGRLGNFVSPYLKEQGYNVTNFDVVPPAADTTNAKERFPFVMGDLLSLGDCMRAIAHAQADTIVHLGAIPFNTETQPAYSQEYNRKIQGGARFTQMRDEDQTMKVNTMGTYYLLDAARRLNVKKFIFISTYYALGIGSNISGDPFVPDYLPIDENHPCRPEDTYGLSKLLGEETCKTFSKAYGMDVVVLRLLGVYYHDNEMSRRIYKFNTNVPPAEDKDDTYFSGNTYQYADARDIAVLVKLGIEAQNLSPFEVFYTATDSVYKEDTTEVLAKRYPGLKEMGKDIKGTDGIISIEKAKRLLGYEPAFSWRNNKDN